MNNCPVALKQIYKYLGLRLDSKSSLVVHIDYVEKTRKTVCDYLEA